jgi:hypothetical protein
VYKRQDLPLVIGRHFSQDAEIATPVEWSLIND